jgi:hypothetical protein
MIVESDGMRTETRIPDTTWTHSALPKILDAIPIDCRSLVDVGCGRGIIGALCRVYRAPERLVGIDGFEPYIDFCRRMNFYDEMDLLELKNLPLRFKTREFHVATCIEVIEHLPKDGGEALLDELERIAPVIILTTPGIYFDQDEYDGNPFQKHLSYWKANEFRQRGYLVYGVGALNTGHAIRRIMGKVFGPSLTMATDKSIGGPARRISEALGPLTRPWPRLSSKLLCIRA